MDALPIEAGARVDVADLARQVESYGAQKLIEMTVGAKDILEDEPAGALIDPLFSRGAGPQFVRK